MSCWRRNGDASSRRNFNTTAYFDRAGTVLRESCGEIIRYSLRILIECLSGLGCTRMYHHSSTQSSALKLRYSRRRASRRRQNPSSLPGPSPTHYQLSLPVETADVKHDRVRRSEDSLHSTTGIPVMSASVKSTMAEAVHPNWRVIIRCSVAWVSRPHTISHREHEEAVSSCSAICNRADASVNNREAEMECCCVLYSARIFSRLDCHAWRCMLMKISIS